MSPDASSSSNTPERHLRTYSSAPKGNDQQVPKWWLVVNAWVITEYST